MSEFGERLASIFAELVERAPDERQQRLDALADEDADLAAELVSLLAAHDADQDFLSPPDALAVAHLLDADDREQMPERAGNWRLIRELGRGGLGVVYLAERADEDYQQSAAVKLIKRGMDSEAILERFQNERRILATLDHPNIARLMDGGVLSDGRPWFAMECVDGESITRWSERQSLPVEARLRLFAQVCRAVQSAHARLVVHRDLKPSNILVTQGGQVKLLDFGIAKLLANDTGPAMDLTRAGVHVMTPEYASPEQIEGGEVSAATDVYALGVVLYELLSGQHPYREEVDTREQLTEAIRESRPVLPSARLARRRVNSPIGRRQLSGDLDAIVLTAMAGSVDARYASVDALMEDIQRHLEGLPVRARARSRGYRLGRFLHRYRVAVSAVAAVIASMGVGLGIALWQANEARHQTMLAEQSREFVISLLSDIAPSTSPEGVEMRAVEVLRSAADRVESADDLAPVIQGRLAGVIAEVLLELGSVDRAVRLAELGVNRLEASQDRDLGLLANNYAILARMQVNRGDDDASEAAAVRGLALIDRLDELSDADRLTRIELLDMQARRFGNRFEADLAIEMRRRSLRERIALFGPDHVNVAAGHNNLAAELHTGGEFQAAERHYRALGRIMEQIDPDHPRRANVFLGLGVTQSAQGRLAEAEAALQQALETAREHYGESSGLVASCRAHLGHLHRIQLRFEPAQALFKAVALGSAAEQASYVQAVASSWLGLLSLSLDQPVAAIDHLSRSRTMLDSLGHPTHPQQWIGALGLSLAQARSAGMPPDQHALEEIMTRLLAAGAGPSQLHGEGAELMAALQWFSGNEQAAQHWLHQARTLFADHFGPDHPRTLAVGHLYPQSTGSIAID